MWRGEWCFHVGVGCSAGQMLCCLRLLAESGELTVNGLEVSQKIPKGKMIQECCMMTLLSFKYGIESFVLWLRWGGRKYQSSTLTCARGERQAFAPGVLNQTLQGFYISVSIAS